MICLTGGLIEPDVSDAFQHLRLFLDSLCRKLAFGGRPPRLFIVPGPSDAARIDAQGAAALLLLHWFENSQIRDTFFDAKRGAELRQSVEQTFAPYGRTPNR